MEHGGPRNQEVFRTMDEPKKQCCCFVESVSLSPKRPQEEQNKKRNQAMGGDEPNLTV